MILDVLSIVSRAYDFALARKMLMGEQRVDALKSFNDEFLDGASPRTTRRWRSCSVPLQKYGGNQRLVFLVNALAEKDPSSRFMGDWETEEAPKRMSKHDICACGRLVRALEFEPLSCACALFYPPTVRWDTLISLLASSRMNAL